MSWRGLDLLYLPWKKVNQSNMKEERIRYSCQRQVDSASVLIPSHVPAEVFTLHSYHRHEAARGDTHRIDFLS